MIESNHVLILRDNAKRELMQIQSVEDGITYLNKLKTIDVWVKAEKKDAELQNIIAEQKLRTQRILGQLLKDGKESGDVATRGGNTGKNQYAEFANVPDRNNATLDEIGISRKQSSTFQQIASIPEEDFEEFIAEKKEAVNNAVAELTTTGAVRLARSLNEKKRDLDAHLEDQAQLDAEKELKKIAHEINMTYTRDQRKFFINLIKV